MKFRSKLLILCAILFICELTLRTIYFSTEPPSYVAWLRMCSGGYVSERYCGQEFFDERSLARSYIRSQIDGTEVYDDFNGKYITFRENVRFTPNQPNTSASLWLFGSSTVMNFETRDTSTLSAKLQMLIGTQYRVVNMGRTGIDAAGQLRWLEHTPVKANDIIIFYDGSNELNFALKQLDKRHGEQWYMRPCTGLGGLNLGIILLYCRWASSQVSLNDNKAALDIDIADATRSYRNVIEAAKNYAFMHQAKFFHVTQAIMLGRAPTPSERPIVSNYHLLPPIQADLIRYAWSNLSDPGALDLTHALDRLRDTRAIYIDAWHINAEGNEMLAEIIADYIIGF